jgi:hypothetical protein
VLCDCPVGFRTDVHINLLCDMRFMKICTIKTKLFLVASVNLHSYVPHFLSDLGEIWYKDLNIMLFSICKFTKIRAGRQMFSYDHKQK